MRIIKSTLAALLLASSLSAVAATKGQFNNECAWGLANDKHVKTDCSVNMTGEDGKTYCFSNDKALAAYMSNPVQNLARATDTFGRK